MPALVVTAETGTHVTGLTVGTVYRVESSGGPFKRNPSFPDTYIWQVSLDGFTWSAFIGTSNDPHQPQSETYWPMWVASRFDTDLYHVALDFTAQQTDFYIRVGDQPGLFYDNVGSLDYVLTTIGSFCQYGVQANPDSSLTQVITDSLIDLVVAAALAGTGQVELIPYVETMLAAIEGITFISINCSTMPTGNTNLDLRNPGTYSLANLQAWFQQAAWHYFCQCVPAPPGSAPAAQPFKPTVQTPTGVATTQPPSTCDNTDLCTYLAAMKTELQQLLAQVSYLRTDVRWIQRHHVPFSYLPGALHSGLSGSGDFAVSAILGLAVQVTTVPGASGEEAGDPIARFGLGWVTTGTADGWRNSVPIRHNPQWVDVEADDTLVGYSFPPLVVANIEEFSPQP